MKLSGVIFGLAWSRTQTFSALFSPPNQPPLITTTPRQLLALTTTQSICAVSAHSTQDALPRHRPIMAHPIHPPPPSPSRNSSSLPLFPFITFLAQSNTSSRHAYLQNTLSRTLHPLPERPRSVHQNPQKSQLSRHQHPTQTHPGQRSL